MGFGDAAETVLVRTYIVLVLTNSCMLAKLYSSGKAFKQCGQQMRCVIYEQLCVVNAVDNLITSCTKLQQILFLFYFYTINTFNINERITYF